MITQWQSISAYIDGSMGRKKKEHYQCTRFPLEAIDNFTLKYIWNTYHNLFVLYSKQDSKINFANHIAYLVSTMFCFIEPVKSICNVDVLV